MPSCGRNHADAVASQGFCPQRQPESEFSGCLCRYPLQYATFLLTHPAVFRYRRRTVWLRKNLFSGCLNVLTRGSLKTEPDKPTPSREAKPLRRATMSKKNQRAYLDDISANKPARKSPPSRQAKGSLKTSKASFNKAQSSPCPPPNSRKTPTTGHSTLPNANSPLASPTASCLPLSSKKLSAGKTYPNPMKSTIKQPMPAKSSLRNIPTHH